MWVYSIIKCSFVKKSIGVVFRKNRKVETVDKNLLPLLSSCVFQQQIVRNNVFLFEFKAYVYEKLLRRVLNTEKRREWTSLVDMQKAWILLREQRLNFLSFYNLSYMIYLLTYSEYWYIYYSRVLLKLSRVAEFIRKIKKKRNFTRYNTFNVNCWNIYFR